MITEINTQVNLGYKTTNLTIKQVGRVNLLLGKDAARTVVKYLVDTKQKTRP